MQVPFLATMTCGGNNGGGPRPHPTPDAGIDAPAPPVDAPPDAPPTGTPGGLTRLDWRTNRGAPIASHAIAIPGAGGSLFAISNTSFVTQTGCEDPLGCALTWRDLQGTVGARIAHTQRVTFTSIAPDGRHAQVVATDALETCTDDVGAFPVVRGTLELLDLATGAATVSLPIRSNTWSAQGFTPFNDYFFAAPIKGTACLADALGWLATSAPFAPPPGLLATDTFVQAISPQRWIVQHNTGTLGTVDPTKANSFQQLTGKTFDVTQGWFHTYTGFADLVQDAVSTSPTGASHPTALHDDDWHAAGARGRWFRVCGQPQTAGFRNCRVVDGQGELAAVNFPVNFTTASSDTTVLLTGGAVVFVGPLGDGTSAVQRITLATGKRDVLHPGPGTLQALGDGAGALLVQDGAAWYIEADREERVADHVVQVISAPQTPFLRGRAAGRQDDVALVVSAMDSGGFSLALLDARTRRLARVTDGLFFTQPAGSPFSFADTCGQPWTTRSAGANQLEGLLQQPGQLYFVERGNPATMWLVPIDLAAPPRKLGDLAGDPASCHAPLASPDGQRFGFAENTADGTATRVVLSSDAR
ncbi:MAG TPA: hypothetical protein VFP84_26075 [Kofleriaceae bacterium]|nr:hypothetical protein [Kofleriaceae bacterium]